MKQKLISRKFWVLVTMLVTSILVLFDAKTETVTEVTAIIGLTGATITYLLVQGKLDEKDWFGDDQSH